MKQKIKTIKNYKNFIITKYIIFTENIYNKFTIQELNNFFKNIFPLAIINFLKKTHQNIYVDSNISLYMFDKYIYINQYIYIHNSLRKRSKTIKDNFSNCSIIPLVKE